MSSATVKNNVTVLVCCHKKDFCHEGEGFYPIHVGKALHPELDLGIPGDNTGDNISAKNLNYCELTAHYWMWKNGPETKYVGLNHYRRYFDFRSELPRWVPLRIVGENKINENELDLPDLDRELKRHDIILPRRIVFPHSLADDYRWAHINEDLEILDEVVKDYYPEYYSSFRYIMYRTNWLAHYNMFITRREIFEDYSAWLFGVLAKAEEKVKISAYPFQARVFGYMAERLLNVYVHKHDLKVKYLPVIKVSDERPLSSGVWFRKLLKNSGAWYLTKGYLNRE